MLTGFATISAKEWFCIALYLAIVALVWWLK